MRSAEEDMRCEAFLVCLLCFFFLKRKRMCLNEALSVTKKKKGNCFS